MIKIDKTKVDSYHQKRVKLMAIYLVIWAIVSYGAVSVAPYLNHFKLNGFPFGYFMAAQGAIITFVILLFVNSIMSDKIDREFDINQIHENPQIDVNESENERF